jgi:hypothetical protein
VTDDPDDTPFKVPLVIIAILCLRRADATDRYRELSGKYAQILTRDPGPPPGIVWFGPKARIAT